MRVYLNSTNCMGLKMGVSVFQDCDVLGPVVLVVGIY